jgi:Mor family transcriptional regulator
MRDALDLASLEPDIVSLVLQKVMAMAPAFSQTLASQIEQEIKASHGGQRLFIPKGPKRMTPQQRNAVYQDGLTSMDNKAITDKHSISRRTLYRVMKDGGGRFSGTP